jgi:hypothetical protein
VDKIPEDRDARSAFLKEWARSQQDRLDGEERRRRHAGDAARADEEERRCAEEIARVAAQARQRIGQADPLREGDEAIPVVITKASDLPVDRAAVFADLMVGLRECKWADPILSECDEPRYIAPNAIDLARRHRPDAPWLLYMEDDVILGPDFRLLPGLLREADELFPDTGVVSFFSGWHRDPGWSIHTMDRFGWLQCAAIRNTEYLVGFGGEAEQLHEHPDKAVRDFLAIEYDAYALWCPSLVQHAVVTSAFLGQTTDAARTSWSYRQAYG